MPRPRSAPRPRLRAKRRPALERREEILQAAVEIFARKGYRETGTAEIAARAGVSEPTVYRYFASKRELYLAAIDRSAAEILGRWREMARDSATPLDALLGLGQWYFDRLRRDPAPLLLRARAQLDAEDPEVRDRLRAQFLETFDFVQGLYEEARRQGLVPKDLDLRSHTWLFFALGALIDATELLGLRERLDFDEVGRMLLTLAPELLQGTGARARAV